MKKMTLNLITLMTLVVVAVLRGGTEPSIIGVTRCSTGDWILFLALIFILVMVTLQATKVITTEYKEKI